MRKMLFSIRARVLPVALVVFAVSLSALAQGDGKQAATSAPAPTNTAKTGAAKVDEKAVAVVEHAIESMGGRAFLDIKTIVSSGYFTPFRDGVQTTPIAFVDYMVFPDRERTEFKGGGSKGIETHIGNGGWLYDAQSKTLSEYTPAQVSDNRILFQTSLYTILRGWWRSEGASLSYVGRREAGLGRRNEVVRITYADGFEAEFEFDAKEGTPAKVKYKKQSAEGDTLEEEDRYAQFVPVGAARIPFIIDHFRAGVQSSRVNYSDAEFNKPVADSLFTKPADPKKVKF